VRRHALLTICVRLYILYDTQILREAGAVEEEYFTLNEIAALAKVTRTTVYGWMNAGALHFVYIGRQRRIPKSAWLAFVRPGNLVPSEERGQKEVTPVPVI
jgi:excisionase family DNA binding protein